MRFGVLLLAILFFEVSEKQVAFGSQSTATAESPGPDSAFPAQQPPADALRARLSLSPPSGIGIGTFALLQRFYASHGYAPLWTDISGISPTGDVLLARLGRIAAGQSSLSPILTAAASRAPWHGGQQLAELEVLLSAGLIGTAIDPG